jgi:hypothetical protein
LRPTRAGAGLHRVKIFTHWGVMDPSDPSRLTPSTAAALASTLAATKAAGLRPTLLLASIASAPCPLVHDTVRLVAPAEVGSRRLSLDPASAGKIVRGLTGLASAGAILGAPLFTSLGADGVAELSRPLASRLDAGPLDVITFRFSPLPRPRAADGSLDPVFADAERGWLAYVRAVTAVARDALGGDGFDVEVDGVGAPFATLDAYYDPPPSTEGTGDATAELFTASVGWLRDPAHGVAGVVIGDGRRNAVKAVGANPAIAGVDAWVRNVAGEGLRFRSDAPSPDPAPALDALGSPEGAFTPSYDAYFPELPLHAIEGGALVWDLLARAAAAGPPQLWLTSAKLDASWPADHGITMTSEQRGRMRAKFALRELVSFVGVGVDVVHFFGPTDDDDFALVAPGAPGGGPALSALARLLAALPAGDGVTSSAPAVSLVGVASCAARSQVAGDGTPAHPGVRDVDAVAAFPFGIDDHRIAIVAYVMTRSLATLHGPDAKDPRAFDLPDALTTLELSGLGSSAATVAAFDPLSGDAVPVTASPAGPDRLRLDVALTDSPRVLLVQRP